MSHIEPPYDTPQKLASHIRADFFPHHYPLPYNRFTFEQSSQWWISPTSEKEAYPYGKAVFSTESNWVPVGHVFCGYNVEKGLVNFENQLADKDFGNPRWVLKPDWMWNRFTQQPVDELKQMLVNADNKTEFPTLIIVNCGPLVENAPWDRVEFVMKDDQLEPASYEGNNQSLEPLSGMTNLETFQSALRDLSGQANAWNWIDLYIGSHFPLTMNNDEDLHPCVSLVSTFLPWITAGEEPN